jgi:hypothetical protein
VKKPSPKPCNPGVPATVGEQSEPLDPTVKNTSPKSSATEIN